MPAGSDLITVLALGGFTLVLAALYALQIKRTATVQRDLAAAREAARAAEAALPERLAAHERALIDAIAVPVWRRDRDGTLRHGNAGAGPLLPELEKATSLAERAVKLGRAQSESRNMVVHGDRRLVDLTEAPTAGGEGGLPDGTVGTARDLTTLEQLQSELARHVDAHAEVLETLHTAVAVFGPDKRLIFANTAFGRLWGVDAELLERDPTLTEVLERARENRRLPEQSDFRAWRDDFNRLFTTLIGSHEELLFLPDDTTVRMAVTPHPFGGLLMVFEDVTDRLSLERSYNTLTAVQQETLDNLYEGIAAFGADGRLKLINPTFRNQWGLPAGFGDDEPHVALVLEAMRPRFSEQDRWETVKAEWVARLAEREPRSGRIEKSDGRVLDYGLVPLPDGAMLLNFRDVTDTLAVQHALQERTEALEMADRLKSEFLANVSYELRTPLNAIIGFSEILEQEYAGPMNDRQKEYARAILQSSNRLVRLVNDILDLASIEAGYLELDRADVDPARLADAVEHLGRERARARRIDFTVRTGDGIAPIVVDERRLTQALYNLVSNAFAFTPDGGRVQVSVEDDGDAVLFRVTDTGVGIAHEDQSRVFDRFERAGRDAGAGLGLALVKSLIELHNGTVNLVSEPGHGTEVVCRIPRTARRPAAGA
ncbi:two-component sensor histidine kinase [Thalassobaculum fulvum]|uniref:histidine kinase n=1 Tax=Thalassobaculum fulvum TaxID=1633335 RepID=A0A919CMP6_9PROT|nr:PAS domain-containing sensor histidine kinase [Thalassobaculum fulvum]GHD40617.1 two-component sensor histidine kinase [Thalassobaculum fulvum]